MPHQFQLVHAYGKISRKPKIASPRLIIAHCNCVFPNLSQKQVIPNVYSNVWYEWVILDT